MTNKKATTRPTTADRQREAARQARRQAAMERRQDDYRQDAGFKAMYAQEAGR